jgi:hypothetical protein
MTTSCRGARRYVSRRPPHRPPAHLRVREAIWHKAVLGLHSLQGLHDLLHSAMRRRQDWGGRSGREEADRAPTAAQKRARTRSPGPV